MKNKIVKCYRFLKEDMKSKHDGKTEWELNKWIKIQGTVECCENGLHACRDPLQSLNNIYGDRWFIGEARGTIIDKDDKFAASEMRVVKELPLKKIAVEFSIACALRSIKNYEKQYPNDDRPRKAIEAAKAYLKNPTETLRKVAETSASAAESAAESARSAAWSAARSAAWSAAWSARSAAWSARSAAWSARSAAWSAAWSAAESAAWSAAWSAARSAAWSARSAARSAEELWQKETLLKIVKKYEKSSHKIHSTNSEAHG